MCGCCDGKLFKSAESRNVCHCFCIRCLDTNKFFSHPAVIMCHKLFFYLRFQFIERNQVTYCSQKGTVARDQRGSHGAEMYSNKTEKKYFSSVCYGSCLVLGWCACMSARNTVRHDSWYTSDVIAFYRSSRAGIHFEVDHPLPTEQCKKSSEPTASILNSSGISIYMHCSYPRGYNKRLPCIPAFSHTQCFMFQMYFEFVASQSWSYMVHSRDVH